jgi:hypothetical protein
MFLLSVERGAVRLAGGQRSDDDEEVTRVLGAEPQPRSLVTLDQLSERAFFDDLQRTLVVPEEQDPPADHLHTTSGTWTRRQTMVDTPRPSEAWEDETLDGRGRRKQSAPRAVASGRDLYDAVLSARLHDTPTPAKQTRPSKARLKSFRPARPSSPTKVLDPGSEVATAATRPARRTDPRALSQPRPIRARPSATRPASQQTGASRVADRLAEISASRGSQSRPSAPPASSPSVLVVPGAGSPRAIPATEVSAAVSLAGTVAYRAQRATGPGMGLRVDESAIVPARRRRGGRWPFAFKAAIIGVLVAALATSGGLLYFRLLAPAASQPAKTKDEGQVVTLTIVQPAEAPSAVARKDRVARQSGDEGEVRAAQRATPAQASSKAKRAANRSRRALARAEVADLLAAGEGKPAVSRRRRAKVDVDGILEAAVDGRRPAPRPRARRSAQPDLELTYDPPTESTLDEDEQADATSLLPDVR